ncbi:hypothetical protein R3P38DRAFT_1294132 [Favolaschia claudopus]|uniref:Uncharacterized protein n=1 Tax=Favolaschia claudopus TaxID=2862362 RepID=A0AAW0AY41_9AGAR
MISSLSIASSLSSWAGPLSDTNVLDSEFYSISIEPPSPQDGPLPNTDVSDFHSIPIEFNSSSRPARRRYPDHKHTPSRPSPLGRLPVITPTTIFFESGTLPRLAHTMLVDRDSSSISSNPILEAVARPTAAAQIGLGHPRGPLSVSSSSTGPSSSSLSSRPRISSSTIRSSKPSRISSRRESRCFGDAAEDEDGTAAGLSVIQEFIVRRELETLF